MEPIENDLIEENYREANPSPRLVQIIQSTGRPIHQQGGIPRMADMDPGTLITLVTILMAGVGILLGTIIPALVEGRAVLKALEGMTRQPEVAGQLRTTLLISMALLESTAIYVLLILLVLLFANPLLDRFF
jgi:F-type H+-transporting ATPase subunit c